MHDALRCLDEGPAAPALFTACRSADLNPLDVREGLMERGVAKASKNANWCR